MLLLCAGRVKERKMKKTIIVLVIYLSGCVFGYKYTKHNLLSPPTPIKTWKVSDRNFSIGLSLGSWLTVAAMGIVDLIQSLNNDTPAKW